MLLAEAKLDLSKIINYDNFIVQDTVVMIINYDRNTFIVEVAESLCRDSLDFLGPEQKAFSMIIYTESCAVSEWVCQCQSIRPKPNFC